MFLKVFYYILGGIHYTMGFAVLAFILGFIFGLIMAMQRCFSGGFFSFLLKGLSSFIRGTPIIFQSILSIYCVAYVLEYSPTLVVLLFVLVLNSSCYLCEILLASFKSIPTIQYDVAKILNFNKAQTIKYIILPQTLINTKTLLINELTSLVKETSILAFVGMADIMFRAKTIVSQTYELFIPMAIVGVLYYLINITFEQFIGLQLFRFMKFITNKLF